MGLGVVGFMAFGLALSFYRTVLFEETLQDIKKKNTRLIEEIETGYQDLAHVRSQQYRDKYAKENLGLVNPGERVLIISQAQKEDHLPQNTLSLEERQRVLFEEFLRQTPIIEHWQLFLFEREKLEQLKRTL